MTSRATALKPYAMSLIGSLRDFSKDVGGDCVVSTESHQRQDACRLRAT